MDHGTLENGQPYLAMEWLEGEDLAHRLLRKPLSLSEVVSLLRRAAEGLATAHQQNIVHRDLKPSNLFLRGGRPEDVVLLDFGLARHAVPSLMGVTARRGHLLAGLCAVRVPHGPAALRRAGVGARAVAAAGRDGVAPP